jgi:quinoprotein glucose dehydrogenase
MKSAWIMILACAAALAQPAKVRDGDWPMYNRDLAGTRYSPLTQINAGNVTRLKKVWSYRFRTDEERAVLRANLGAFSEVTPIVVDGLMYLTAGPRVLALQPETGKEVWRYEAKAPVSKRGVSYWPGDKDTPPRIIATSDLNMIALNPKTGRLVPGFGNEGVVRMTVPALICVSGEYRCAPGSRP